MSRLLDRARLPDPMADPGEEAIRWVSYEQLAGTFGISVESARRLCSRQRWRRTLGNDGRARIAVPEAELLERKRKAGKRSRRAKNKKAANHQALLRQLDDLKAASARIEAELLAAISALQHETERKTALSREVAALRAKAEASAAQVEGLTVLLAMERSRREHLQEEVANLLRRYGPVFS